MTPTRTVAVTVMEISAATVTEIFRVTATGTSPVMAMGIQEQGELPAAATPGL